MQPKVLMIDDDLDILEFMEYNLKKEGYQVITLNRINNAIEIAIKEIPDIIILDIKMPDGNGISLCEELRKSSVLENSIIIFLTAAVEDNSQITSFEVGADDYCVKPIKPRILIARIKALLKRRKVKPATTYSLFSNTFQIDLESRIIRIGKRNLHLPKKAFDIISILAANPGKVYKREDIYRLVWNKPINKTDRSLDVHIRQIRKIIGEEYIVTVKGVGFKLNY